MKVSAACKTRECRETKRYLKLLITNVEVALASIDKEMNKPSDSERGKRIAAICNGVEMAKDLAKRFGLKQK